MLKSRSSTVNVADELQAAEIMTLLHMTDCEVALPDVADLELNVKRETVLSDRLTPSAALPSHNAIRLSESTNPSGVSHSI